MPTPFASLSAIDQQHLLHALRLSQRGIGRTGTNPSVGCVLAQGGTVVGAGYTAASGRPHAEEIAIEKAGDLTKGVTAYVTLEPCHHQSSRTESPPCAVQLMQAGVQKVICLQEDADPRTAGQGFQSLQDHGVDVVLVDGVEVPGNQGFTARLQQKRPYIIIKIATSLDGKIALADGTSKWLTSPAARQTGQLLRARADAMLIGRKTAEKDIPKLTCRLPGLQKHSPDVFVIDGQRTLPAAHFENRAQPWRRFVSEQLLLSDVDTFINIPVPVIENGIDHGVDLPEMLQQLARQRYNTLLVEGGGQTIASLLRENLVDEIHWFHASIIIGDEGRTGVGALNIQDLTQQRYRVVSDCSFPVADKTFGGDRLTILKPLPKSH